MKTIRIGGVPLLIKDYYCSQDETYIEKKDGKLWLYVNVSELCPCSCPFCVNPCRRTGENPFDLLRYRDILTQIKDAVYAVSFTGGEPLLFPELLGEVIRTTYEIMGPDVELDLATCGIGLERFLNLQASDLLYNIHISRHLVNDDTNRKLMGADTPDVSELKSIIRNMREPGRVVLNCVLHRDGVHSTESVADYLEMAAEIGVTNTSFIGLIKANSFCLEQYIDPKELHPEKDTRFRVWNHFHDHSYCNCSSGDYDALAGCVRYYYRSPGSAAAPYARQLVYTADNKLLAGFGGEVIFG